ncbi:MAG: hypothetical protein FJ147_11670 [Deltaproteobacteria bacterium]|nr:hypothetical protein [Deltaproteobacteria bacterium]
MQRRVQSLIVTIAIALFTVFFLTSPLFAEGGYPTGYTASKPAAQGETNVLARFGAIVTYMNDKLNASGGRDSSQCYRNCLTAGMNEVLKCIEVKNTYASSESCEKDGAQKMSVCDPKCQ